MKEMKEVSEKYFKLKQVQQHQMHRQDPQQFEGSKNFGMLNLEIGYRNKISIQNTDANESSGKLFSVSHIVKNYHKRIEKQTTFTIGDKIYCLKDIFEHKQGEVRQNEKQINYTALILNKTQGVSAQQTFLQKRIWQNIIRKIHKSFFQWLRNNQSPILKEIFKSSRSILHKMVLQNKQLSRPFAMIFEHIQLTQAMKTFLFHNRQQLVAKLSGPTIKKKLQKIISKLLQKNSFEKSKYH